MPSIESLVGPTIATVPIVVRIDKEDDLVNLIRQIQTQAVNMIPYQQTGLQEIRQISAEMDRQSQFNTLLLC